MSDTVTREYSVTVRLSTEERALLEALADRFQLDKSATIRKVLALVTAEERPLASTGQFIPLHAGDHTFPVRLSERGTHE